MLFDILALIFVIITIILLRRLINIFPSLMACTIRWKESINLEASVKHSLDRDMLAAAMFIPFCLAVEKFDLYTPQFMENMSPDLHLTVFIVAEGADHHAAMTGMLMVHIKIRLGGMEYAISGLT